MSEPNQQEIRAALDDRASHRDSGSPRTTLPAALAALTEDYAQALTASAFESELPEEERNPIAEAFALWVDLPPSEARRLRAITNEPIVRAAERCDAIIRDELVAAGRQFAKEYPDASRQRDAVSS